MGFLLLFIDIAEYPGYLFKSCFLEDWPEDLRRERSAALGVQCSVNQALKTPQDTVDLGALLFSLYATPVLLFSSVI